MDVYLEVGKKRTFAGAIDWPGWCRSGKDEAFALQALLDYGPRSARAIGSAQLAFVAPEKIDDFSVVERLKGNVGTDFGAPVVSPSVDAAPVGEADLERYQAMLMAIWRSFDSAVKEAEGKELSTGHRGGGRDLEKIIAHVYGADQGYLYPSRWDANQGGEKRRAASGSSSIAPGHSKLHGAGCQR